MDEHGTYDQNVAAQEALDAALDDMGWVNTLITIEKAGECCEKYEPARTAKFFNALENIVQGVKDAKVDRVTSKLEEILPEAHEILEKYDTRTGTIHKDIRR